MLVFIMFRLPYVLYNGLQESKKWQERKEALDALQKLTEAPKIEPGDYNELVRMLKKVVVSCCSSQLS